VPGADSKQRRATGTDAVGWIHSRTPNSPGGLSGDRCLGHGPGTCQALVATGLVPRALPLAMRRPTQRETWRTMAGDCEGCAVRIRPDRTSCRGSRMRSCEMAERAKSGTSSEHAETGVLTASGRMQRPRDGCAGEQLRANGTTIVHWKQCCNRLQTVPMAS
jgi:hypothetical protein